MSVLQARDGRPSSGGARFCRDCDRVLSRYNEEDRCHQCIRCRPESPRTRPRVPSRVWELPEVQRALLQHDFGYVCMQVRRHASLRQEDLALLTGLSQAFLSMLEGGARRLTSIDKIVQLLDGLDVPIELTGPMLRTTAASDPLPSARRLMPSPR